MNNFLTIVSIITKLVATIIIAKALIKQSKSKQQTS